MLDRLKQFVPPGMRRRAKTQLRNVRSHLPRPVRDLAALVSIGRRLPTSGLKIALYDPQTGVLRFPATFAEAAYAVNRGQIADATGWMPKIDGHLPAGGIVLDVGGFRGVTAQWFARRAGQVHVFEPTPESAESIALALRARGLSNVFIHRLAVSDHEGTGELNVHISKGHNSLGRVKSSRRLYSIPVETTTLDGFAARNGIDFVDFLKIDVEGFEFEVLKGAERLLADKRIGCILFEANEPVLASLGKTSAEIHDYLTAQGYAVTDLHGRPVARGELASESYDDFLAKPRG